MRIPQIVLSFFLLFALAFALPIVVSTPGSVAAVKKRAGGKGGGAGGGGGGRGGGGGGARGGGGGRGNTAAEVKGINQNISIQKQEKQDTKAVSKAEKGSPQQFNAAKGQLLTTIQKGQGQRAKNQANADKSNKQLVNGLNKVQGAQAQEQQLAQSLKGGNTKSDRNTLKTLQSDFNSGIKQNEANRAAAQNGGRGGGGGGKGGRRN
ncbi:hypothetical protein MCOR25_004878 [Pyricularia grisea]|uniref:Uncharacterized protein n=1 Tax=Pyricularia grisea TaxID=148305 RepID=A0A6P8BFN0_PYRGI|nr:uncharacterized protein PgNI_02552 [Pyricularia grisea]KAI6367513.1 hypothetical protein MCOR25_004878 [Pyricularia grisea]TLD15457.1 hypothetical protein PgNI_02552 [Pyricularia grisea]